MHLRLKYFLIVFKCQNYKIRFRLKYVKESKKKKYIYIGSMHDSKIL